MKKIVLSLVIAGLTIAATGCGSSTDQGTTSDEGVVSDNVESEGQNASEADDGSSANEKVFRLGVNGSEETGYLMELAGLAYEDGYLEEELNNIGYDLEVSAFAGGSVINEAYAAGELDGAIYGEFPAFVSKSNGFDTTVVANLNSEYQFGILTSDSSIQEAKDLEGKKVIVMLGTSTQYFWEKYVEYYNLDEESIEIINASTDTASLLASGEADAYVSSMYAVAYLEEQGYGTIIDDGSEVEEGWTTFVLTVNSQLLDEEPELGVAINKALIRAYNDAAADPNLLYDAVATVNYSAEIMAYQYAFDTSLWYMSPEITEDNIDFYETLNEWLLENAIITQEVEVDEFFDQSYYQQALDELNAE